MFLELLEWLIVAVVVIAVCTLGILGYAHFAEGNYKVNIYDESGKVIIKSVNSKQRPSVNANGSIWYFDPAANAYVTTNRKFEWYRVGE